MNFTEALELSYAKHGGNNLPWEISKDAYLVIFQQGWHAHAESLKQIDMFPGTWAQDPISASEAKSDLRRTCNAEEASANLATGSILTEMVFSVVASSVTAENIYDAYPRHVGRQAAIKAIRKALKDSDRTAYGLLRQVQAYAAAVAQWPAADKQFIPHPATWFNRGSYDDNPAEWQRGGAATSQFSKTY